MTKESIGKVGSTRGVGAILWKVHAALIVVQLSYGSSYVVSKIALTSGINPIVFAAYRDLVCLVVLLPVAWYFERDKRTPLTIKIAALLVGLGFSGAFATQLLLLYGIALTSAAYSATISILTPVFTFIISVAFGFELIGWGSRAGQAKVLGLVTAVSGALVLALYVGPAVLGTTGTGLHAITLLEVGSTSLLEWLSVYLKLGPWQIGVFLIFLSGFTLSVSISIQVPILTKYPAPMSVSAFAYFLGAAMLWMTALLATNDSSVWVIHEISHMLAITYNGVFVAAFSYTLLIWSVHKAGPVLTASYVPLQLFFTGVLAYLVLGETIHLGCVLGALLIITGLVFITWAKVRTQDVATLPVKPVPPMDGMPVSTTSSILEEPLLG